MFYSTRSTDSTRSTRSTHSHRAGSQFFVTLFLLLCLATAPAFAGEPEENDPDPGFAQPGQTQPVTPPNAEEPAAAVTARLEASRQDDDLAERLLRAWQRILDRARLDVTR